MPGEFVASPDTPISSQPIGFSSSVQSASQSKAGPQQAESSRQSLESVDSVAKDKQRRMRPHTPLRSAFSSAKARLSPSSKGQGVLAGSEEEYQKLKAKEEEKQKRNEEYERLRLGDKVKFGQGGMNMNG